MSDTESTTAELTDLQPLGYDTRRVDPWLAVIRFALLIGAVWGSVLIVEFVGFLLSTHEQRSTLTVQFLLGTQAVVNAGGMVGCLIFGALLLVSAMECLKLRRRARKTFVVCVIGGAVSVIAAHVSDWYYIAFWWWEAITGPGRTPSLGWTITTIIRPMHLAIIPATLVYLMTRQSVKQRFD